MTDDVSLEGWRLVTDLTVVDAAILIVGGDPSHTETVFDPHGEEYYEAKVTSGHKGYDGTFAGLTGAILSGSLRATLKYAIEDAEQPRSKLGENFWLLTKQDLNPFFEGGANFSWNSGNVRIAKNPDWDMTTINVDNLKAWLRSKGRMTGFFFPEPKNADEADAFMDENHDHFSPDVALAISAWRALSNEQRFPRGVKAAIEDWIDAHPEAWKGEESLSLAAKERIATLVNWKRTGGAPRTGS